MEMTLLLAEKQDRSFLLFLSRLSKKNIKKKKPIPILSSLVVFSEGCPVPRPHHHHAEKWILGSQALIRNLHICTHSNSPAGDTILPKPSLHLRCWSPWPVTSPGGIKEIPGSHCRPGLHPWSPIFRLWEAVWFRGERSRL